MGSSQSGDSEDELEGQTETALQRFPADGILHAASDSTTKTKGPKYSRRGQCRSDAKEINFGREVEPNRRKSAKTRERVQGRDAPLHKQGKASICVVSENMLMHKKCSI